jgi:hypothetical protein
MPNRQLTDSERAELFAPLLSDVRSRLRELAGGDDPLYWALRRKLFKELSYDERGKPAVRRKLKQRKTKEQGGLCTLCGAALPEQDTVQDRLDTMTGYTMANTRVICRPCDLRIQTERNFS